LLHLTVWCSSCISCVQFTDTDESKRDAHPMCCGSTHSHPSVHGILVLIIPLFPLSAHRCTSSLLADSVTQSLTASCSSWSRINSHARTRTHARTHAHAHTHIQMPAHTKTSHTHFCTLLQCRAVPHSTHLTLTLVCRRTHTSIQAPIHWVRDRSRPTASAPWSTANVQALYSTATMAD
jgi:hypothetical protein